MTGDITIVIPVRNEGAYIEQCLDSVLSFDGIERVQSILLVDGQSTDDTASKILQYQQKDPRVQLLSNPKMIVPVALNIGIRAAETRYIVRLDAHSSYPQNYLKNIYDLLIETGAGNAGGRFLTEPNGTGPWAHPIAYVTSHPFGVGNGAFRIGGGKGFVDTVPFGIFPRAVFDEIGYFDERLTRNQDNEFNARLRKHGYKIAFDPSIVIHYKNQSELGGLLHQAFYTGMWNVYTLTLHPYTFRWRRFIPAAFTLYLLSLLLLLIIFPAGIAALIYSVPLVLYLVLALSFSFAAPLSLAGKGRVFLVFILYHLGYGLGALWGVCNRLLGTWHRYLGKVIKR